jgi:hypothetical protein
MAGIDGHDRLGLLLWLKAVLLAGLGSGQEHRRSAFTPPELQVCWSSRFELRASVGPGVRVRGSFKVVCCCLVSWAGGCLCCGVNFALRAGVTSAADIRDQGRGLRRSL